jgi:acetyl-CoA acetyltransferase
MSSLGVEQPPIGGVAAIVGVGNTRYGEDYRNRERPRTARDLAAEAFARAIEDSGLAPADIDGLAVARAPGGVQPDAAFLASLGLAPAWIQPPEVEDPLTVAIEAMAAGKCSTVALLYASDQRSASVKYGGAATASKYYLSYYYYHPWGFSSQGAHWALMTQRHRLLYGSTEEQLGAVAVAQRRHARLNPDAVMQKPLSLDDYLASRYVCRPLHLPDYCMVNDGGVVLILRRAERARGGRQQPVLIAGSASVHVTADAAQLRPQVLDLQYGAIRAAADACFAQARLTRRDVKHLQVYDAFSINVPIALEGVGFCKRGEGLQFVQGGRIEVGGELPCNTSGGMLSESYMHGWNHAVEAVRQLRGQGGKRQVAGADVSLYTIFTSEMSKSLLYRSMP